MFVRAIGSGRHTKNAYHTIDLGQRSKQITSAIVGHVGRMVANEGTNTSKTQNTIVTKFPRHSLATIKLTIRIDNLLTPPFFTGRIHQMTLHADPIGPTRPTEPVRTGCVPVDTSKYAS